MLTLLISIHYLYHIHNHMSIQKWWKERKKKKRLEEVRKNPYKRVDSDKMTDIEKMDKGFNGKTYSVNGLDVDF